jgi:hypothetical protein
MIIIWQVLMGLFSSYLLYAVLINPCSKKVYTDGWKNNPLLKIANENNVDSIIFVFAVFCFAIIILLASFLLTQEYAVLIISIIEYCLSLAAYFTLKRFVSPIRQPYISQSFPIIYTLLGMVGLLSFCVSSILCGIWYMIIFTVVIWFAVGFISTEIMIESSIKRSIRNEKEINRETAIEMLNYLQGRNGLLERRRYPFPIFLSEYIQNKIGVKKIYK